MKRRRRAFTPADLEARLAEIDAFVSPAPPPPVVTDASSDEPQPRSARTGVRSGPKAPDVVAGRSGRGCWPTDELEERAKLVAINWSALSGRAVAVSDARRVARLSMPLTMILVSFHETWIRRTGLGLAWPGLREAERLHHDAQVVPAQPHR